MIHPIQAFKEMPAKKKAAVVAGTAAAVGAVAVGAAFVKGGKVVNADNFIKTNKKGEDVSKKFTTRLSEGFKSIGASIKTAFKKKPAAEKPVENTENIVEQAAEKIEA